MSEPSPSPAAPRPGPDSGGWQRRSLPEARFIRSLGVGLLGINILVAVAMAFVFADSRRSEEQKYRAEATTVVRLIGKDVESQYGRIDLGLRVVADEYGRQLAHGRQQLERWLERVSQRHPALGFIVISDADGRIVDAPEASPAGGVNISDREYFIRLRDDPQLGLAIAPPLTGRISGKTVVAMARRLGAREQPFSGVAVASVPVDYLKGMLSGLFSEPASYVGLLDSQLRWVAAAPALPAGAQAGTPLAGGALRAALAGLPVGTVVVKSDDGSEQLVAYARNSTYGFTVLVARSAAVPLVDWWRKVVAGGVAMAVFALLTTLLGWLLVRSWKQQSAMTASLLERDEWVRQAQRVGGLALFSYDLSSQRFAVSDALYAITGTDVDYPHTWPGWLALVHADDRQALDLAFRGVARGEVDGPALEYRIVRRGDGELRWLRSVAHLVAAADGVKQTITGVVRDITVQKHDEDALRKSEQRLRASEADLQAAVDQAAVGIAFVACDGRWLRVNERLCELVGYTESELLAMRFQDITHPDDLARDLAQLERTLRREIDRYTLEKRYIRKDGRCLWINLSVSLIRNDEGTPKHFVSIVEDIDARKNAEQDSRRVRGLLQGFLDHLPGLAAIKDQQRRVVFANRGLQAALKRDDAGILGRGNGELFPGELGETLDALDRRVLAAGETEVTELAYAGRVYQTTSFIIGQDDGPAALGAIVLDVTRRHRLERRMEALLEINERAGTLAEKEFLAYGLEVAEKLTASDVGFLHFVNDDQESIELSTWTAGALKGCAAMFDSHYPLSEAGIWADCCRQRRAVCFNDYGEYAARRGLPDGHAPLQRLISVPVIEQGAVRMVVGVGNKIAAYDDFDVETVQVIANAVWSVVQRARAEAALARRLAEVTALNGKLEDAHLQLLQSEKMSAIGQLAAGVAHELNNPIGFVHSNLGTLGEYVEELLAIDAAYRRVEELPALAGSSALDEVRRLKAASDHAYLVEDLPKLIHESKEGLERVHKIVLDLRDFSRVGESEWQWTDIQKGLESTINIVWNELKYKADVERQYTPLPPIRCLASQLNQVFMNLLVNAAQAIETSGRIVIRTGTDAASGDTADAGAAVWVEIEDSGRGMAPEVQKRLFEPFYTTKPVGKGTGLGLSISFAIVARHHGRIEFRSEVGRGTTFRITLPIDASQADSANE